MPLWNSHLLVQLNSILIYQPWSTSTAVVIWLGPSKRKTRTAGPWPAKYLVSFFNVEYSLASDGNNLDNIYQGLGERRQLGMPFNLMQIQPLRRFRLCCLALNRTEMLTKQLTGPRTCCPIRGRCCENCLTAGSSTGAALACQVAYDFIRKQDYTLLTGVLLMFPFTAPSTYDGKYKELLTSRQENTEGVPIINLMAFKRILST